MWKWTCCRLSAMEGGLEDSFAVTANIPHVSQLTRRHNTPSDSSLTEVVFPHLHRNRFFVLSILNNNTREDVTLFFRSDKLHQKTGLHRFLVERHPLNYIRTNARVPRSTA